MTRVLRALLHAPNPPVHYNLSERDVALIAACYDWEGRLENYNCHHGTNYALNEFVYCFPNTFLVDISRYYGDDFYLGLG